MGDVPAPANRHRGIEWMDLIVSWSRLAAFPDAFQAVSDPWQATSRADKQCSDCPFSEQ